MRAIVDNHVKRAVDLDQSPQGGGISLVAYLDRYTFTGVNAGILT